MPTTADPTQNFVHIFFSPGGVTGDVLNAVACHAMRAAADRTGWILVSVRGKAGGSETIKASDLTSFLTATGRGARVDKLRLSGHSRGVDSLGATLAAKILVGTKTEVERLVAFDEDGTGVSAKTTFAGIAASKAFGYRINAQTWNFPANRTVNLMPIGQSMRVFGYCRLIDDALDLKRTLAVPLPSDLAAIVDGLKIDILGLKRLPLTSDLTSRKPPAAGTYVFDYVQKTKPAEFKKARAAEAKLHDFVDGQNDLARLGSSFPGGIYQHHLFVSEFAHEVTEVDPPGT